MININELSETSLNKLKVCTRLIENQILDYGCNKIIFFTDEVEIIGNSLKRILNMCGIYINLYVLPFSDRVKYKDKISEDTIVLEIFDLFNLYRITFLNTTSYIIYNESDKFIEVRTKIYEPIFDGVYYEW